MRAALSLLLLLGAALPAQAQSAAARKAAREALEFLRTRFAREVAEEGMERLEGRLARAADRWGDEALEAVRRVGPRIALREIDRGGAAAARILARGGDDGARLLATRGEQALAVARTLGDDGIDFLLRRHGTVAAERLPALAAPMARSGRAADFLRVLEKHGDRAADFLWRHKGVVFGGALMAAFLSDPEPYLAGIKELVAKPAADLARDAVRATNWTLVFLAVVALGGGALLVRTRRKKPAGP